MQLNIGLTVRNEDLCEDFKMKANMKLKQKGYNNVLE